jgi:hypothetical protein
MKVERMKTTPAERDELQRLADRDSGASAGTDFMARSRFQDFCTSNLVQRLLFDLNNLMCSEHNALVEMAKMYDERPSLIIQQLEQVTQQRDALALRVKSLEANEAP